MQLLTSLSNCMRAAQSAGYLTYSEADFEVFTLQGRHVAPMGVKFGTEEGSLSCVPNFTLIGATVRV